MIADGEVLFDDVILRFVNNMVHVLFDVAAALGELEQVEPLIVLLLKVWCQRSGIPRVEM